MTDLREPTERPPATGPGLARLAALLAELLEPSSAAAIGRGAAEVAEALTAAGIPAALHDGGDGDATRSELVVALDGESGSTTSGSRSWVARLLAMAGRAVVFGASGPPGRSPAWWDDLFAAHEFEAVDVLRAALWDDPSWDAAVISSLTLYVSSVEQATIQALRTSPIPRSAVHPGVFAPARQAMEAVDQLSRRLAPDSPPEATPVTTVVRVVEHHEAAAADARAEVERLKADAEFMRDSNARAEMDLNQAKEEWHRALEARLRAERESAMLREEIGSLLESGSEGAGAESVSATADGPAVAVTAVPGLRDLFDHWYYVEQVPGLIGSGMDSLEHYLREGWRRGLDPHPLFDTNWYRRSHSGARKGGITPLEHYVSGGWREGCDPHPLFDVDWYLRRSPDVAAVGMNPLVHYLQYGWHENRDPHPLFNTAWYRSRHPHLEASGMCPLVHYVRYGWHQGYELGELFDAKWYVASYPEAEASGLAPYRYFLEIGVRRGDRPSPWAEGLDD